MKNPYKIIGLAIVIVSIIIHLATQDRSIHEHHPHHDHGSDGHLDIIPLENREEIAEELEEEP